MDVGLWRNERHDYWAAYDGVTVGPMPSVTGVLRVVDKSGPLVGWAKREAARCAVQNLETVNTMVQTGGQEAAIKWVASIPDFQRDTAADLGTRIHAIADAIAHKQPVVLTDEERPFVDGYSAWVRDWRPTIVASEFMVANLTYQYAGTGDLVVDMAGERWMLDIKSSKGVYQETGLQLAGYAFAEFAGKPGDPKKYRVPKATRYGVLHLRPEGYRLVPFAVTDETWRAFIAARELHSWLNGEATGIVGKPLEMGRKAA